MPRVFRLAPFAVRSRTDRVPARRALIWAALSLLAGQGAAVASASAQRAAMPGDSIVRVAVDSALAGEASVLMLLDEMDVSLEADGRSRRTHRNVIQVAAQSAVSGAAERRFSWQPGRQTFSLDWVRVLRPDGTVISDAASTDQTSDATASMQNPIYVDSRTRRISIAGIAQNTIVDVQYTIVDSAPWRPGDFHIGWNFSPPGPLRMSLLRVSVPDDFAPRIAERNLNFKRTERDAAGRHIYEWRANAPSTVRPEPFPSDSDGVHMSVELSAPQPWDSVAQWYTRLAAPQTTIDPATAAKLDSVARGATTRRDSLLALHKWIAQDIRYVSVSLGLGGYQPRSPAEVLATGYGDCKDKATLFVAAARRWGIEAYPVLLHLNGVPRLEPVTIARFNHAIAAVADGAGGYVFTDLTAATIPYGELPASYRGSYGLVVRENGSSEMVRFPERSPDSTGTTTRLTGVLSATGRMDMVVLDVPRGDNAWAMRAAFAVPLDSTRRAQGLRAMAAQYLPEASGDSIEVFDGLDFTETPSLRAVFTNGRGARAAGPVWLLHLPQPYRQISAGAAASARELDAQPRRRTPIDADKVVNTRTVDVEYRVRLPDGWSAELPSNVTATSFFARYESSYRMEGRDLVLHRTIRGAGAGAAPPERVAEVVAWMRSVARDDHEFITLTASPPDRQ